MTIYCYRCGQIIGEIKKGKWKKGSKGICVECHTTEVKKAAADKLAGLGNKSDPISDMF